MSDSDDDRLPNLPRAPRQKRFRFKTFAERVAEVDVDVYRSRAQVKAEPSNGSWLADALVQWRELNSGSHFLQTAAELQPLCQTLPQLLHHREAIARLLLSTLQPAARLSLPGLLALLAAFVRDLQAEALSLLPRAVKRIVALLDGGAEREPESLEAIFTCVSLLCKHLARPLASDLPAALRATAPLRYHAASHVRQFAAQAVGFLLRSAPSQAALRAGVRAVLAEQAARPSEERTDGAGLVLAEAVLGVQHGLHSRASALLGLLLREDLIAPGDLRPAKARAAAKKAAAAAKVAAAAGAPDASTAAEGNGNAAAEGEEAGAAITREQLRARAAAVARVALARLLDHTRRGKAGELWAALFGEARSRLKAFEAAAAAAAAAGQQRDAGVESQQEKRDGDGTSGGLGTEGAAAGRSLGRGVLLVAQAVGYFRGSRVEDYGPLFELLARLMQPASWMPTARLSAAASSPGSSSPESGSQPESPVGSPGGRRTAAARDEQLDEHQGEEDEQDEPLLAVSLSYAVLELARAVAYGHLKVVGASEGPGALARVAGGWAPAFARPPPAEALPFVKALMVPPAGEAIARVFAPQMLGCLGRVLMAEGLAARRQRVREAGGGAGAGDYGGAALLLLKDLCELLQPQGSARTAGLPLLLTAQPGGVRLAAHVRGLVTSWRAEGAAADPRVAATAWAAVSLLPAACESAAQAVAACEAVLEGTASLLHGSGDASGSGRKGGAAAHDSVLLLRATATELLAELLPRQQQSQQGALSASLVAAAKSSLDWALSQSQAATQPQDAASGAPVDFAGIRAAGALLSAVRSAIDAAAGQTAEGAASAPSTALSAAPSAALSEARGLLSESRLCEVAPPLAALLAHPSQPLRAAVLRLLCCFDQPALSELAPGPKDPTAGMGQGGKKAAAAAPRCDLLPVLHGINSQPFSIENGRKWAVAMGRLKTYLEYDRIPGFLVPSMVHGMCGVLYIRFSPLWQPAAETLSACLRFQTRASWPIAHAFLRTAQHQLLTADSPRFSSGGGGGRGGRYRSAAAVSAAAMAAPLSEGPPPAEDASYLETLEERYNGAVAAGTPAAAGGVTDPQNRLSHMLRAMTGAPHNIIEQHSKDWVPLFIEYTAARGSHNDDGEEEGAVKRPAQGAEGAEGAKEGEQAEGARPRKKAKTAGGAAVPAKGAAEQNGVSEHEAQGEDGAAERRRSHASASTSHVAEGKRGGKGKRQADKAAATSTITSPSAAAEAAEAVEVVEEGEEDVQPGGRGGGSVLSRIGGKTWRSGLVDWLALLAGLKGIRGLARCEEVQVAVASHLLEADSAVQVAALRCLRPFRFRWLPPEMADRLARLADDSTLREELALFPAAPGAEGGVGEEARPGLIPLLIRTLFPKMRKRSGRLGGRGASGSARAAILNALAVLRPAELRPLLELLLEPMAGVFAQPEEGAGGKGFRSGGAAAEAEAVAADAWRLIAPPWWSAPMLGRSLGWWLAAVQPAAVEAMPPRRKVGFLNAFEDLLSHLGHGMEPFLPPLLAITLRLLAAAAAPVAAATAAQQQQQRVDKDMPDADGQAAHAEPQGEGSAPEGAAGATAAVAPPTHGSVPASSNDRDREVRSASLRLLAQVWLRFPASPSADYNEAWGVFLPAVAPLVPRLQWEAAASKEPPLLECILSLSLSPGLARVLGDRPSVPDATLSLARPAGSAAAAAAATAAAARGYMEVDDAAAEGVAERREVEVEVEVAEWAQEGGEVEEWQAAGLGGALVRGCVAMLRTAKCSEVVRVTVLDVLDALLGCGGAVSSRVLLPHLDAVLGALHAAIEQAWQAPAQRGQGKRGGGRRRPPSASAHRELAILERLGGHCGDPALAARLAGALVALLQQAASRASARRGGAAGRLDQGGVARALGALAALWGRLRPGDLPREDVERYCEALSMWAIRLTARDARSALAVAYGAVARLLPYMAPTAASLAALTSWAVGSLDEPDYEARLGAYSALSAGRWASMRRLQALPLLLTCLHDLRSATDMALRQAAATSLEHLIAALVEAEAAAAAAPAVGAEAEAEAEDGGEGGGGILSLASRVLYPQLKSQLGAPSLPVRQEHVSALRALVAGLPGRFPGLAGLLSGDVETDFFANVAHLQSHRRTRALVKLTKLLKQPAQPSPNTSDTAAAAPPPLERSLLDVIAPLLQQFILEASGLTNGNEGRAHEKKQTDLDKEANVTDAAITCLGAVAGRLAWHQYEQLLNQFVKLMRRRPAKPLIRAVCAILDAFHFALPATDEESEAGAAALRAATAAAEAASAAKAAVAAEAALGGASKAGAKDIEGAADKAEGAQANSGKEERQEGKGAEDEEEEPEDGEEADEDADAEPEAAADPRIAAASIQRALLTRILPALHEQLVERKKGEDEEGAAAVRAPVALALCKLLKLLPPAAERAELPRALQGVANLLRSRIQRIRDDARAVLVSMMAELGPHYLPYACHVLRASLPDRGFTAHVIGYTLHAVLEAVVKVSAGQAPAAAAAAVAAAEAAGGAEAAEAGAEEVVKAYRAEAEGGGDGELVKEGEEEGGVPVGVLDDSLELCLPLVEADLFGEVSEAKEAAAFASQHKEAKRCRAYEAYQLLAQGISFASHARLLLTPVTARLHLAGQPSVRAKLTRLMAFAARGVRLNPTAGPQQIMSLVVSLMGGCLDREEAARARAKEAAGPAASAAAGLAPMAAAAQAAGREVADADRAALHEYLVLEFCLTLLHSGVRRGVLSGRAPALLAALDPCLPLLVRALRSRHAGCVSLSLRTLATLVPLPLPGMARAAPGAGKALQDLLRRVPNIQHPIAQDCFRLLAALLRDCAAYRPAPAQLRFLLTWAFTDLGQAGAQPTAFSLLRALLSRRVVLPEVYDVMDRVQQIMIRSQSAPVRHSCGVALLQFLLDFPLGPKRLAGHVTFLLANTGYEYESGRLAALEMLGQVAAKFPAEVLQTQSDALVMPLVVRLVSDPSPKARAAAASVLRSLLGRLEPPALDRAVGYCRTWLEKGAGGQGGGGQAGELRRAAAQTLGLVVEVEGARFARRMGDVAPPLLRMLEQQAAATEAAADAEEEGGRTADGESDASESACPGWQEAYYALLLLEKVAAAAGGALAWPTGRSDAAALAAGGTQPCADVPALWEAAVRLLLHRHLWVRKAAARLVGYGLAAPRVAEGLLGGRPGRGRTGALAYAFYLQLEAEAADEATCLQAVKCLVSLGVQLAREEGGEGASGEAAGQEEDVDKAAKQQDGDGAVEEEVEEDDGQEAGAGQEEDAGEDGEAAVAAPAEGADPDAADADDAADDAADGVSMADQVARRAFTLRGLVRRMARLADDSRWVRARQRTAALRWTAAAASALGPAAIGPHLPVLLRPLYRISEAAAAPAGAAGSLVADDVRQLAEEVMAHLRGLVGSEALLAAYNAAREHVRGARQERRRRAAVRGMVDPAAAAAARLAHSARKAEGRKRKMEQMKRERGAGGGGGRGKARWGQGRGGKAPRRG